MRRALSLGSRWPLRLSEWRRDALRATLWLVPTVQIVVVVALFLVTYLIDRSADDGGLELPGWVDNGSADAARQILTAIAAAIITVIGLVFSVTIVALTLASTQFGPRILRNFTRDRGTQLALGAFVSTFVYVVLALGSIGHGARGDFVPHLSITVALGLVLVDLGVLVYFIHHVATTIQLPQVIASIAHDLTTAIDVEVGRRVDTNGLEAGLSEAEIIRRFDESGALVPATRSGYVQFIGYQTFVDIAIRADGVIRLLHLPGTSSSKACRSPRCGRPMPPTRSPAAWLDRTRRAPTARSPRTSHSPSTSWSRSRCGRCRRPSTTPSPQ